MDNNHLNIQDPYICSSNFKDCQYKILDNGVFFCGFFSSFVKFNKAFRIEKERICPELKNKLLHHDYLADIINEQSKRFLDQVKNGEIVYCTTEMKDVVFLKKPKNRFDWCQYKTLEGKIKEARTHCFRKISLGNKCAEYKTTEIDDLNASEILAREYGFRVEKDTLKNSYLLRIYGDEQEDVDHFVICLENNYFIY